MCALIWVVQVKDLHREADNALLFFYLVTRSPPLPRSTQAPLDGPLQPGASFGGLLDLCPSTSSPPPCCCYQLSVVLETEEEVAAAHSAGRLTTQGQGRVMRTMHCEHQVCRPCVLKSSWLHFVQSDNRNIPPAE